MVTVFTILLLAGALLMALASFGVPKDGKPNLWFLGWSLVVFGFAIGRMPIASG